MFEIWVLVITIYSSLLGHDSVTLHVKSFRAYEDCQVEGKDFQNSLFIRIEFVCVPHYTRKI